MSLHFYGIKVKEIRRETNDCVSVALDIPEELQSAFQYKQGQNVTLKTNINGEEVRRSYSLCSSPLSKEFRIAIKKVEGGLFSTYANEQLQVGDQLDVMPPVGKFYTELATANRKNYIAIASGSGITPILSIITTTLLTEPNSHFTLVYGNRNRASIIFKEALEALKNKFLNRFQLLHILSREKMDAEINFGRIDASKCEHLFAKNLNLNADEFFICGPEEMIFSVKDFLENKGIDTNKIHFELFAATKPKSQTVNQIAATDNVPKSNITIKVDGRSFDFDLPFNGTNILDAALAQGADLPYACKGGVCCTCKAKLLQGNVDMEVCWGLEHEEIEQGFILTCQAHPTTEKVVVDFDIK